MADSTGGYGAAADLGGGVVSAIFGGKARKKAFNYQKAMDEKNFDEQKREYDAQMAQRQNEFGNLSAEQIQQNKQFGQTFGEQQSEFGQTFGLAKDTAAARQAAYQNMLAQGRENAMSGENQLMGETAAPPPEMAQAENDLMSGTSRSVQSAQNQIQANAAQQGVRGGQAVTQLRRGVGDIQTAGMENINAMKLDDASKRRATRAAYLASKASSGTNAQLSPATF